MQAEQAKMQKIIFSNPNSVALTSSSKQGLNANQLTQNAKHH